MTQSNEPLPLKYEQPRSMSRSELEREFTSGDGSRIADALISSFYSETPEWVQKSCLRFVEHSDSHARRAAAIVLGNVSHMNAREVDLIVSHAALQKLEADQEESVKLAAQDSMILVLHMVGLLKKQ